jgi:hypothetical protein
MQQPAPIPPPPPYSSHQPTPIGWAINHIPNEHPSGKDNHYHPHPSANNFVCQ